MAKAIGVNLHWVSQENCQNTAPTALGGFAAFGNLIFWSDSLCTKLMPVASRLFKGCRKFVQPELGTE
jgi:hypothetical protein